MLYNLLHKLLHKLKEYLKIEDDLYILDKPSRGIASKKEIKKGENIVIIPNKFLLQPSTISYFKKLKNKVHDNSIFAYFLYQESKKGKESPWNFYIKTFPSKKSVKEDYPLFLSQEIKKKIKDTEFGKLLEEHEKNIKDDFYILKNFFQENTVKYDDYLYYRLLVTSRIFGYNNNIYMVPYIDLFNHSKKANTRWYYKNGNFILEATKKILPHSEIYDSYGDVSNTYLYLYYGFTFPEKKKSKKFLNIDNINLRRVLG